MAFAVAAARSSPASHHAKSASMESLPALMPWMTASVENVLNDGTSDHEYDDDEASVTLVDKDDDDDSCCYPALHHNPVNNQPDGHSINTNMASLQASLSDLVLALCWQAKTNKAVDRAPTRPSRRRSFFKEDKDDVRIITKTASWSSSTTLRDVLLIRLPALQQQPSMSIASLAVRENNRSCRCSCRSTVSLPNANR